MRQFFFINLITPNIRSISDLDICNEVKKYSILKEVFLGVFTGRWPNKIKDIPDELAPYYNKQNELAIKPGCLIWGHRFVIPTIFRSELLSELHSTHMEIVKMKSLARSYMWWPKIDVNIENITKECDNPPKFVLHSWLQLGCPAQRRHLDFLRPVKRETCLYA